MTTKITEMGPSRFCDLCGHHRVNHFRIEASVGEASIPCVATVGSQQNPHGCGCRNYCEGFSVSDNSPTGLICQHCLEPAFNHHSVAEKLKDLTESHANRLAVMTGGDVPYKVLQHAMKLCCLWAIDYHMRTSSDEEIKLMVPGYAIECPMCQRIGRLQVVEDTFVIGPTWKWAYKRD